MIYRKNIDAGLAEIMCVQFDPHTDFLACGTRNAAINVYNMESGELFREIQKADPREYEIRDTGYVDVLYPVTSFRWIPDIGGEIGHDTLVASYANSAIKFWDVGNSKKEYEINERDNLGIYTLDYSRVGDKIATGGVDRKVRVYSNTTKELICELYGAINDKEHIHHLNRIH